MPDLTAEDFIATMKESGKIKTEPANPAPEAIKAPETPAPETVIKPETPQNPATPATPVELTDDLRLKAINEVWSSDYKSIDEIKVKKAELDEIPTLREFKTKYEEVAAKPVDTFANDKIRELNNFIAATGYEDIQILREVKRYEAIADKSPVDTLVLAKLLQHPELIDDKEMVRLSIEREYNTSVKKGELGEELEGDALKSEQERVKLEQFRQKTASLEAQKIIQDVQKKLQDYKPASVKSLADIEKKKSDTLSKWNGVFGQFGEKLFSEIQVSVGKDSEGKAQFTDTIKLSPDEMKAAIGNAVQIAVANNLEPTEETLGKLVDAQKKFMLLEKWEAVAQKYADNRVANEKLLWEKQIHNPSLPGNQSRPGEGQAEKSGADKLSEAINQRFGT